PCHHPSFCLLLPPPPRSTLFPYTTLFRSSGSRTAASPISTCVGRNSPTSNSATASSTSSISTAPRPAESRFRTAQSVFSNARRRSEEHTSELQSRFDLVCRLLLEKKKTEH